MSIRKLRTAAFTVYGIVVVLTLLLASSTVFLVTAIAGSMVVGLLYVLTSPEPDTTDETRSTRTERRANRRK